PLGLHSFPSRRSSDLAGGEVPAPPGTTYPVDLTCPRISPPRFFGVWTFTYVARLFSITSLWAEVTVSVLTTGDLQGPHRVTSTGDRKSTRLNSSHVAI